MTLVRKITSLFAGAGMLVAASGAALAQEKTVKVGLLSDFSGVFAQLAKDVEDAWMLALEERGGMVAGYKVEIVKEDSENSPQAAVQKANKLIKSDNVTIFGGSISSGVGIALAGVADKEKTPYVAGFSIADALTGKFCSPYVARTSFSANALQAAAGAYWAKKGVKTAVFMGPDYAAGQAMLAGFKNGFEAAGGKVVLEELTPFKTTKDWGPSLLKAQQTGADMIYTFYAGSEAVQVVKQHAAFGMQEKMPLRGAMWIYDEALWDAMGGVEIGAIHVTNYTNALDTEASERFEKAFEAKYGRLPVASNAMGYTNAVAIFDGLAKAIEDNGGNLPEDKSKIIAALASLKLYSDPRGPVHFNSSNNAMQDELYMVQIVKGDDGKPHHKVIDTLPYGEDLPGCNMQ
ncbi:MAG: ABC transporter substrate-binding protein [Rhodobiaceae bacterium]|nr:ABC transporter substrate-binding protein [Rhodobiaceae bacterium]MCC0052105.1 ABC transporter substrate-binding protein [Rhodobiaceae bacterium]MCC0061375.1 ABC transporter substrate-binding protein [Rhodobiaceae bacterium]